MSSTSWNASADWNLWVPQISGGEIRVYNGSLKLPFNPVSHQGIVVQSTTAHYRFGQNQSLASEGGAQNAITIPSGLSSEVSELGFRNPNRNGYAKNSSATGSVFNFPDTSSRYYVSFWFKSSISDYSSRAYIVSYHSGLSGAEDTSCGNISAGQGGTVGWAIIVDSDNTIKAVCRGDVSSSDKDYCISPVGGPVSVDTNWHHVLLLIGRIESAGAQRSTDFLLVVDNNFVNSPTQNTDSRDLGTNQSFNIGSNEYGNQYGFMGTVDEIFIGKWTGTNSGSGSTRTERFGLANSDFVTSYRFLPTIFLSPVLNSGVDSSIVSSILANFDTPNDSYVQFSFRASDTLFSQTSTDIPWSGFTLTDQITSDSSANLENLGINVRGRYYQVRVLLTPSNERSDIVDYLFVESPSLNSLTISTSLPTALVKLTSPAYVLGSISGQIVSYKGSKTIHKTTLGLDITANSKVSYIVGSGDNISFQAANFQDSRHSWVFQPHFHWIGNWETSGITIKNTLQTDKYLEDVDAVANAPYLSYDLYFPDGGTYNLWGYGYIDGTGAFWSFNNDENDLRTFTLGQHDSGTQGIPKWTNFGTVFIEEAGIYTFKVYLRDIDTVILDQWFFTKNINLDYDLGIIGDDAFFTPLPLSKCPFMTAVRLRTLLSGSLDDLDDPYFGATSITSWLPSKHMYASGKYNYDIRNNISSSGIVFTDGVSLEFFQIGGSKDFFASWDYIFTDSSIGTAFSSTNYGQTYE